MPALREEARFAAASACRIHDREPQAVAAADTPPPSRAHFDFHLPEHLIAQHPAARRDESRLLVVRRDAGTFEHRTFRDLPELLTAGDLLVVNDTKVLPARLVGRREGTGGAWVGLFLSVAGGLWEVLTQNCGYPGAGAVCVTDTGLRLTLRGRTEDRHWLMESGEPGSPPELLARFGHVPLPPFIRNGCAADEDVERYQTGVRRAGRFGGGPDGGVALHAGTL